MWWELEVQSSSAEAPFSLFQKWCWESFLQCSNLLLVTLSTVLKGLLNASWSAILSLPLPTWKLLSALADRVRIFLPAVLIVMHRGRCCMVFNYVCIAAFIPYIALQFAFHRIQTVTQQKTTLEIKGAIKIQFKINMNILMWACCGPPECILWDAVAAGKCCCLKRWTRGNYL